MYTLKSIVQRGALLGAAAALFVAAVVPAASVFADSLNPLTERSLLLSSSAPGFQDTDASGNSESNPNAWNGGEYYALPGSGPNGKKSGQTFSFRVSTDSDATSTPIKALSFQYCTTAAGNCQAPGNNTGDQRNTDRETNATAHPLKRSDLDVVGVFTEGSGAGQFEVLLNGAATSGWTMAAKNVEDDAHSGALTGKNNFVYLTNSTGISPEFNDKITVTFKPSTSVYITNPGQDAFFVKLNSYKTGTEATLLPTTSDNILDGGVTVANVMTDSIHITTKVLETMAFSVGIRNPDTQPVQHGSCDAMQVVNGNRLELGDIDAEYSLATSKAYDVNSYWRLSTNSSGGAVVYYSGDTLRNTVGDHIADMPAKAHSQPGTEQFGLAVVPASADTMDSDPGRPFPGNWVTPTITPLVIGTPYNAGVGTISDATTANNAQFSFNQNSKASPEILASNASGAGGSGGVITCATAKVRYIGNIAADTPAGVYTTKINYLAAPQY